MPLQYENKKGCQLCHLVLMSFCWKSHHRLARQSHYFLFHHLQINSCNVPGSRNSVSPKILYLPWNFLFDDDCKITKPPPLPSVHIFLLYPGKWQFFIFIFGGWKFENLKLKSEPSSVQQPLLFLSWEWKANETFLSRSLISLLFPTSSRRLKNIFGHYLKQIFTLHYCLTTATGEL